MLTLTLAFTAAFLAALTFTPVVRAFARSVGFVDHPDEHRKLHERSVALGGGIAVLGASLFGVASVALWGGHAAESFRESGWEMVPLLIAGATILAVGLADDRVKLRGRQKLAGQILAVVVVMSCGLVVENIQVFGWHFRLGLLAVPFTLFWLLGAINSLNLLDGADGFATTVGIIVCGAIAMMAGFGHNWPEAVVAATLCGALCGFLFFNFPPASVFLGDGGAMFVGLAVGVLAVRSTLKGPATVALAAPLAVLAIPIIDTSAAIVRRSLTGRSLFMTDRGHLHHKLLRQGFGPRTALLVVACLCAATATGALTCMVMNKEIYAIGSAAAVLGVLIASRIFGFHELVLVASRALTFGSSLVAAKNPDSAETVEEVLHLQGTRDWHELWTTFSDFGEQHDLSKVRLDLNIPWLHEGYHAVWTGTKRSDSLEMWHAKIPLSVEGLSFGRLEIAGSIEDGPAHELLSLLAELLESVQPYIEELAVEVPDSQDALASIAVDPIAVDLSPAETPTVGTDKC